MTHSEKLLLKPGDEVMVTDDAGRNAVWVVKYAPWQLGHGAWVIGLQGKSGGYALDRVTARVASIPRQSPSDSEVPGEGGGRS